MAARESRGDALMHQTDLKLSKSLTIWEVVGISIALMAPSMAANINPQGPASVVGTAVPLAFLIAAIGVALVSYGFIRLSQSFNHAGSVYGLVGKTLGPRSGVVAGWGLLGTYTFYSVVTTMATGVFGSALLKQLGIVSEPGVALPFIIGGLGLIAIVALAVSSVKRGTRLLLLVVLLPLRLLRWVLFTARPIRAMLLLLDMKHLPQQLLLKMLAWGIGHSTPTLLGLQIRQ